MKGLLEGFDVGVQTRLPEGFESDPSFAGWMRLMSDLGFSVVELNIVEPERIDPVRVVAFLERFGLRMTAFATGACAKALSLSLSHPDETLRGVSVHYCERYIEFGAAMGCPIILGYFKGWRDATVEPLIRSLRELAPLAEKLGVNVVLEATNRFETGVCNRADQALAVLDAVGSDRFRVLLDTFHMNIEETDMLGAFDLAAGRYGSVHLSDNNRFLPGLGAIDFGPIVRHLIDGGFRGIFALEGNIKDSFESDVTAAARCLESLV